MTTTARDALKTTVVHGYEEIGQETSWFEDQHGRRVIIEMQACSRCGHRGYDVTTWQVLDGFDDVLKRHPGIVAVDEFPADTTVPHLVCHSCRTALRQRLVETPLVDAGVLVVIGLSGYSEPLYALATELDNLRGDWSVTDCVDTTGAEVSLWTAQLRMFSDRPPDAPSRDSLPGVHPDVPIGGAGARIHRRTRRLHPRLPPG